MKKSITVFCIIACLILILDSIHFGYSMMMFFFIGVIPGTNIQLTPEQMFGLSAIFASLMIVFYKSRVQSGASKAIQQKTRRLKQV